ncbi:MAG: hypothetical protein QG635_1533, partial [Bacteroidota bacterium]|nr:hypothetical protein [Bacteroidota bacterium]
MRKIIILPKILKMIFGIINIITIILILVSCNETANQNPIKKFKKGTQDENERTYSVDPSNSNNPYDSAGYWHNAALDYIITHASSLTCDSTDFKDQISTIISDFACNTGYEVPGFGCVSYIDTMVDNYFNNLIYLDPYELAEQCCQNNAVEEKFNQLMDSTVSLQYQDSTIETIEAYIDCVKNWEQNIINDQSFTSNERKQLLITSSIARYSIVYWYDEWLNGSNSIWIDPFVCGSKIGINKHHDVPLAMSSHTWVNLVAIGSADLAFGLAYANVWSGATASAVTAIYVYSSEISSGLGWLGSKIS